MKEPSITTKKHGSSSNGQQGAESNDHLGTVAVPIAATAPPRSKRDAEPEVQLLDIHPDILGLLAGSSGGGSSDSASNKATLHLPHNQEGASKAATSPKRKRNAGTQMPAIRGADANAIYLKDPPRAPKLISGLVWKRFVPVDLDDILATSNAEAHVRPAIETYNFDGIFPSLPKPAPVSARPHKDKRFAEADIGNILAARDAIADAWARR